MLHRRPPRYGLCHALGRHSEAFRFVKVVEGTVGQQWLSFLVLIESVPGSVLVTYELIKVYDLNRLSLWLWLFLVESTSSFLR